MNANISLRDHFAGLAMQALLQASISAKTEQGAIAAYAVIPELAYTLADEMIAESCKEKTQ